MRALLVFVVSSAIVAVSISGCQQAPLPPSASTGGSPAANTNNSPSGNTNNLSPNQSSTTKPLRDEIDELKKTVDDLKISVRDVINLLQTKPEDTKLAALREEITALVKENHKSLTAALENKSKALQEGVDSLAASQRELGDAIAQIDSQGRTVPKILSNMQTSPEFRREMRTAVEQVLAQTTHGVLIVTNKTSMRQSVKVNDIYYQIEPLATLQIEVPVGVVTFHLHQYEAPKTLFINPPKLKQEMTISWKYTSPVWTVWEPAPLLSDIRR